MQINLRHLKDPRLAGLFFVPVVLEIPTDDTDDTDFFGEVFLLWIAPYIGLCRILGQQSHLSKLFSALALISVSSV